MPIPLEYAQVENGLKVAVVAAIALCVFALISSVIQFVNYIVIVDVTRHYLDGGPVRDIDRSTNIYGWVGLAVMGLVLIVLIVFAIMAYRWYQQNRTAIASLKKRLAGDYSAVVAKCVSDAWGRKF